MKRVLIMSPYAGDIEANLVYLKRCIIHSLNLGEAPWASHLFYPQILNDNVPELRAQGMDCEFAWLQSADLIAVYTDRGMSCGMAQTLLRMSNAKIRIPTEMRSIDAGDQNS